MDPNYSWERKQMRAWLDAPDETAQYVAEVELESAMSDEPHRHYALLTMIMVLAERLKLATESISELEYDRNKLDSRMARLESMVEAQP